MGKGENREKDKGGKTRKEERGEETEIRVNKDNTQNNSEVPGLRAACAKLELVLVFLESEQTWGPVARYWCVEWRQWMYRQRQMCEEHSQKGKGIAFSRMFSLEFSRITGKGFMVEPHPPQRFCVLLCSFVCFCTAWGIFVPGSGIQPLSSTVEAWSLTLNHQGSPPKVFEGGFINKICPCFEYRLISPFRGQSWLCWQEQKTPHKDLWKGEILDHRTLLILINNNNNNN